MVDLDARESLSREVARNRCVLRGIRVRSWHMFRGVVLSRHLSLSLSISLVLSSVVSLGKAPFLISLLPVGDPPREGCVIDVPSLEKRTKVILFSVCGVFLCACGRLCVCVCKFAGV